MPRFVIFVAVLLCVGAPFIYAQGDVVPEDVNAISHGDFAVLLLKATLGNNADVDPDPVDALERVQILGLVPATWDASGKLTLGELADVLDRFGIVYLPTDSKAPASQPFVEVMLRRELGRLRDYMAKRLALGFSVNHVRDQGVDRAVSPSGFE